MSGFTEMAVEFWRDYLASLDLQRWVPVFRASVIVFVGLIAARVLSRLAERFAVTNLSTHHAMITRRFVYYAVLLMLAVSALRELGFSLSVVLGAAGVLSVAVGFASQTSASNLISGLFLLAERSFVVGDIIKVGGTTGEVLAIDLLSVKLRTFDNLMVRVPNETVIKSEITNMSRFPIRRYDLQLGVAYKEDLGRVRKLLLAVADANPLCLEEPAPIFIFQGFGTSSLDVQFSVWARRENYLDLRNSIPEEIKACFDREGIEIPFPHQSLYAGSESAPFPVHLVSDSGNGPAGSD